jgi:hypothetical protein
MSNGDDTRRNLKTGIFHEYFPQEETKFEGWCSIQQEQCIIQRNIMLHCVQMGV